MVSFSGRLVYPSFADVQRPLALSALNDQIAAGAFMWVFGSLVFLLPVAAIFGRWLSPRFMNFPDLMADGAQDREHARGEVI